MLILACDTSGPSVSVALWRDNAIIIEKTLNVGLIHSKTFMPLVEQIIRQSDCQLSAIDLYAVTTGPGSFTGIRIGVSAVKAMAYAQKKLVVGLTTLDVLAFPYQICQGHLICPMLDARNNRAYAGAWLENKQVLPIQNQTISEFMHAVRCQITSDPSIHSVLFVTSLPLDDAVRPLQSISSVRQAPASLQMPKAAFLADLAAQTWKAGRGQQPEELKATYFVRSAAERLHDTQQA